MLLVEVKYFFVVFKSQFRKEDQHWTSKEKYFLLEKTPRPAHEKKFKQLLDLRKVELRKLTGLLIGYRITEVSPGIH